MKPTSHVLILSLVLSASAVLSEETRTHSAESRAAGSGHWESTRAAGDKRDWQIEVERFDDDSIAGSIIVIGSPSLHKTRVEGRVDGSEVYGVLVADGGKQVGTFTGTIGDRGRLRQLDLGRPGGGAQLEGREDGERRRGVGCRGEAQEGMGDSPRALGFRERIIDEFTLADAAGARAGQPPHLPHLRPSAL